MNRVVLIKKNIKHIFATQTRLFSVKYEGIKGDVNWKDGKLLDGRPNIRKHKSDLPQKRPGSTDIFTFDYSEIIKELENPVRLTYSHKKKSAGKIYDILLEEKK